MGYLWEEKSLSVFMCRASGQGSMRDLLPVFSDNESSAGDRGNGLLESGCLSGLYQMDAAVNLFPSIHCMDSWFCVVVTSEYPETYRAGIMTITWIWAAAICASTLFTKQHGILDVAAGIALAEICYTCVVRWKKMAAVPSVDGEKTGHEK